MSNISEGGEGPNGALKGRKQTPEHIEARVAPLRGRPLSTENKKRLYDLNKGKAVSEETRKKLSLALKDRVFSDEHKQNLSVASANQDMLKCEHCDVSCKPNLFKRYHGDNCKLFTGLSWSNPKVSGTSNKNSKFTEEDIIEIRRLVEVEGLSKAEVGRMYNTRDAHICKIISRQCWAHVA